MRKGLVVGILLLFVLVMAGLSLMVVQDSSNSTVLKGTPVIGVIEINGVIGGGLPSFFGGNTADSGTIMKAIRTAARRPDIKAVVIRINSPGGTSVAAQEIGIELDKLRQTGKPVVTSMGDVCASGGYWIACSSNYIVANASSLTGSIGAIMEVTNLQGLYEKLGISQETIKSGEHKDIGSANREINPLEKEILEGIVTDSYSQFLTQVRKGREGKIQENELSLIADGRIFTGEKALELGLVDSLGNYYDAIKQAEKMAGLKQDSRIEELNKENFWNSLGLEALTSKWLPEYRLWELNY
ncbi:MAG: signal peptide peptidase SppA [Syntrophomonadaceae bacterium]|jgi:protease-4